MTLWMMFSGRYQGAVRALKEGVAVLNADDPKVREMADINPHARAVFYGSGTEVRYDEGIYCRDELLVSPHELPLRGEHFIQNTLAGCSMQGTPVIP